MSPRVAAALLVLVVPVRMALDATWVLPTVSGVSVAAWASGGMALAVAALAASRWRRAVDHPLIGLAAVWTAWVAFGLARADAPLDGLASAVHLVAPIAWMLALHGWWDPDRPAPAAWLAVAALPVAFSVAAWAWGQPAGHVVNGWPRLLGMYSDMHPHAVVMAVWAVGAATWALRPDTPVAPRAAWAVLGLAAAACLVATWVRTPLVMAAVAAAAWLAARGRWRTLAGSAAVGFGAVLAVPALRQRFSDVAALLTGTPPDGGWGAIGSWRGRIWADTTRAWLDGPWTDVAFGRGLGDHVGLHRHLDPHSEWLALAVQLGLVGWALWHVLMVALCGALWRRRGDPDAALAFAWLVGALVTAPLSNDWLTRATAVWLVWGVAAIALRRSLRSGARTPRAAGERSAPPAPPAA